MAGSFLAAVVHFGSCGTWCGFEDKFKAVFFSIARWQRLPRAVRGEGAGANATTRTHRIARREGASGGTAWRVPPLSAFPGHSLRFFSPGGLLRFASEDHTPETFTHARNEIPGPWRVRP